MKYGQIREYDVANGVGVRVSVFVTGCTHNCFNCFNKEYQDFSHGEDWTQETTKKVIEYLDKPQISGLSILGGEPMQNAVELTAIIKKIRPHLREDQDIWLWSGYTLEQILKNKNMRELLCQVDILIDGLYVEKLKDLNLKFRGSSNQRIIKLDNHKDIC